MNRSVRQAVASLRKARSAASWVTCLAHVTYALRQLSPAKGKSAFRKGLGAAHKAKVKGKIQKRRMSTKEIRAAVFTRADDVCEVPGCQRWPTIMDHFLGGAGRRRPRQSVETCWAICATHDVRRTHNVPDAAFWNAAFAQHCANHGYPAMAHVEHAAVPRRSA